MAIAFGLLKSKHGFLRGQEKSVVLAARQKFKLSIRLTLVCFKTQRQLALTFDRVALSGPRNAVGSRFLRLRHDKETSPSSQPHQHTSADDETAPPEFTGRPPWPH